MEKKWATGRGWCRRGQRVSRGKESELEGEASNLKNTFTLNISTKFKRVQKRGRKVVSKNRPSDGGKNFRATEATLKATRVGRTHNIIN